MKGGQSSKEAFPLSLTRANRDPSVRERTHAPEKQDQTWTGPIMANATWLLLSKHTFIRVKASRL